MKHNTKTTRPIYLTGLAILSAHTAYAELETIAEKTNNAIRLEPTLHLRAAHGYTTDDHGDLGYGGHDPQEDNFNLQGLEVGANIYLGEYLSGFTTLNVFKNDGEDFESEFEEGFLKLQNLPGGFEIRGGRMLARFGDQNAKHLHAWDFVDNGIGNVRFLGEDGFAYEGGELTWLAPTPFQSAFSLGFGSAVAHDHDEHGEEEHEEDEHEEDEHGHDEEAEMARPEKDIIAFRYQAQFGANDFNRFQAGVSYLTGENGFGMDTDIYGADVTYTWRENGLEPGGRQFRWRNEYMMRDVENDEGGFEDSSFTTALLYEFIETWEVGLRYEYIEGVEDPELAERQRFSPSLSKRFDFASDLTGIVRLQYNHDEIKDGGTEDSIWLQFGFDWGPGEVR